MPLTVAEYAEAKNLDPDLLAAWGVEDDTYAGAPAVHFDYWNASVANPRKEQGRWRTSLNGDSNFKWTKGATSKKFYGWDRIDRSDPSVVVVEGESDCHTLWQAGYRNVLGVPGVNNVPDSIAAHLKWAETVYVIDEQDDGSPHLIAAMVQRLGDKVRIVTVRPAAKDFSELWLTMNGDVARFRAAVVDIIESWREPTSKEKEKPKSKVPARYTNPAPVVPQGGTLAELMGRYIEPIRFVVDGLIPEGLTILAGKPKLGKSWLALLIALMVCAGREVLGHATRPAEALYIALEDGERRLQDRVRILGGDKLGNALERFHYRTTWPALTGDGIELLEEWMRHHPDTRLIVIDTFGKARGPLAGKDRYQEEYDIVGRLQTFAVSHRVAVVLVHHVRKQGADDWLETIGGSQAITGAADAILGLFRERGQMDATLRLVSRDIDEKDLALRFEGGRWDSMGDAALYRHTVERTEILEALQDLGGTGKVSEVAELVEKTSANTSKLLAKLAIDGAVEKVRYGTYSLKGPVEVVEVVEPTSTTSTKSTTPVDQRGDLPDDAGAHNADYCRCGAVVWKYTPNGFPYCRECGPPVEVPT